MLREGFYCIALLHHSVASWYAVSHVDSSGVTDSFVRRATTDLSWRFFSGWTFTIQILFLVAGVVESALQGCPNVEVTKLRVRLADLKDFVFETFVIPLSCSTSLMFWLLYSIDRKLVFPVGFDEVMPCWLNHAVHTDIILVVLLEMVLAPHHYWRRGLALWALAAYLAAYNVCFLYTYLYDGVFLYPVYDAMSDWFQRVLYMVFGHVMVYSFYLLGEAISRRLHASSGRLKGS